MVIDRFINYMEYRGLNDNQVTVDCGLSVGLIGKARKGKNDLGRNTIEKILKRYRDLNRDWLLTGKGEMLNSETKEPNSNEEDMQMKELIAEQLNCPAEEIKMESSFKEDLGADSLDLFELVMSLEDTYGVEIPSEELEQLTTVESVVDYLKQKGVEA